MGKKERGEGILFKKTEFRENDLIFSCLTKEWGRIDLLAKGVRKSQAKLKTQLEKFNLIEFEFVQGKEFKILTDANLISQFKNLKKDFFCLALAFQIGEMLDLFLRENQGQEHWQDLLKTFEFLNKKGIERKTFFLSFFWFFWNFFSKLGICHLPFFCANCQRKLEKKAFFEKKEAKFLCELCEKAFPEKISLSFENLSLLKKFLNSDILVVKDLKISKENLQTLKEISQGVFEAAKTNYQITD